MFPKTNSLQEMPATGDQTVMKQAAELLEEALRGAGGSMDEIGQNPLFDQVSSKTKDAESAATLAKLKEPTSAAKAGATFGLGPADVDELMKPIAELEKAAAVERARRSESPPPGVLPPLSPMRPAGPALAVVEEASPKNRWLVPVLLAAAVGGLGLFAYTQLHAVPAGESTSAPTPPPSPSASASAAPSAQASATAPAASASAVPGAGSAGVAADAAAAAAASVPATPSHPIAPVAPWHPPPRKPAALATATATSPAPTATDETPPAPPTTSGSAPAPNATTIATDTPTPITAPVPTPSATPKPAPAKPATKPKADDDNPQ
jgi:hypothetical protein